MAQKTVYRFFVLSFLLGNDAADVSQHSGLCEKSLMSPCSKTVPKDDSGKRLRTEVLEVGKSDLVKISAQYQVSANYA